MFLQPQLEALLEAVVILGSSVHVEDNSERTTFNSALSLHREPHLIGNGGGDTLHYTLHSTNTRALKQHRPSSTSSLLHCSGDTEEEDAAARVQAGSRIADGRVVWLDGGSYMVPPRRTSRPHL